MQAAMAHVVRTVLSVGDDDLKWTDESYPPWEQGMELCVHTRGQWLNIAGCGMMTAGELRKAGYDPDQVSCFGFGLGLERLAMLRLGLDDIRKLWQPPYVP
jgi:phenylalanyl-tRNA synthetase alpha subunit